jgi:hypothetical protein
MGAPPTSKIFRRTLPPLGRKRTLKKGGEIIYSHAPLTFFFYIYSYGTTILSVICPRLGVALGGVSLSHWPWGLGRRCAALSGHAAGQKRSPEVLRAHLRLPGTAPRRGGGWLKPPPPPPHTLITLSPSSRVGPRTTSSVSQGRVVLLSAPPCPPAGAHRRSSTGGCDVGCFLHIPEAVQGCFKLLLGRGGQRGGLQRLLQLGRSPSIWRGTLSHCNSGPADAAGAKEGGPSPLPPAHKRRVLLGATGASKDPGL